jgi:hypothetical protein
MRASPSTGSPAAPWLRLLAGASAALVLALTLAAASPAAHDLFHGGDHGTSVQEHACPVVLLASGVDLPTAPTACLPPALVAEATLPVSPESLHLLPVPHRLQPERGPPAS